MGSLPDAKCAIVARSFHMNLRAWRNLIGLLLLVPAELSAHGPLHGDANLFLQRAELHRLDGDWTNALADLDTAQRLNPRLDQLELIRGRTLFDAGRMDQAVLSLRSFLERHPDHVEAWLFQARALVKTGDRRHAAQSYSQAIARAASPPIDAYAERARALAQEGLIDEAIRGLDEGLVRLGPLPALQRLALELETRARRFEAALARVDGMLVGTSRRQFLLACRAALLEEAGRAAEARAAFASVLTAIESLPAAQRVTPAIAELEARTRTRLARLTSSRAVAVENAALPE
jgi:predicted Zn-dependent protease